MGAATAAASSSARKLTTLKFLLNSGSEIPAIGLGTWQSGPSEVREAVKTALQMGYRHIDTAYVYENEAAVGAGIRDSGVPRSEIWVTTKLDNTYHHRVSEGLQTSLKSLGLDYVDLYLMHWPAPTDPSNYKACFPNWDFVKTWTDMQSLDRSLAKNIGVSNFQIRNLNRLLESPSCRIVPAVNQIELHPHYQSPKLLAFCADRGIHCTAYSCLGGTLSPLSRIPEIIDLARRKGKSVQQCLLMWGIQRGTSVIPKSVTESRIRANFELDGWGLEDQEMAMLNNLKGRFKVCGDGWLPVQVFFGEDD